MHLCMCMHVKVVCVYVCVCTRRCVCMCSKYYLSARALLDYQGMFLSVQSNILLEVYGCVGVVYLVSTGGCGAGSKWNKTLVIL